MLTLDALKHISQDDVIIINNKGYLFDVVLMFVQDGVF